VIREAQKHNLDREPAIRNLTDDQLDSWIRSRMYDPFQTVAQKQAAPKALL
jgi:malate dehydrogenase (oxaloacetate-decarboxylating)(NADP+)